MKTYVLSPAGKQPLKIASHIKLGKKESGICVIARSITKQLKRFLTLRNISAIAGGIAGVTAGISSIIYNANGSGDAYITLVVSVIILFLSLVPIFFDLKQI